MKKLILKSIKLLLKVAVVLTLAVVGLLIWANTSDPTEFRSSLESQVQQAHRLLDDYPEHAGLLKRELENTQAALLATYEMPESELKETLSSIHDQHVQVAGTLALCDELMTEIRTHPQHSVFDTPRLDSLEATIRGASEEELPQVLSTVYSELWEEKDQLLTKEMDEALSSRPRVGKKRR